MQHLISSSIKNVRGLSTFATIPPSNIKLNQPLFHHQQALPNLPIPPLSETLAKYLQTARPILNDEEYQKTELLVRELGKPGGMGEVLHQRLLNKQQSLAPHQSSSWLYEWWNSYAYMSYRDPVVLNVNYFFQFMETTRNQTQVETASKLIQAALAFRHLVTTQQLPPETANRQPLCSVQYNYLFNACRVPCAEIDQTATYDPEQYQHIIVMYQNRFYKMDVVKSGVPLSTDIIAQSLHSIVSNPGMTDVPVGILTTEHRDVWFSARKKLVAMDPANARVLDLIQSSIFVICLDDSKPVTREEVGRALWHGDGKNRWFDKHVQFVVFANGKAGFNGEHSMMDATPTGRMCEWMLKALLHNKIIHDTTNKHVCKPEHLEFKVNPELKSMVIEAERQFHNKVDAHDLQVLFFPGYGKGYIKSQRMSPDGYVQMAIQLAYYKMYNRVSATYESAQTRKFAYGRTETGRSVSNASVAFVKAMRDNFNDKEHVVQLLKAAIAYHGKYMKECSEGRGIDRHFLGLKLSVKESEQVPSLFKDPGFLKTGHWILSTSQLTSELFDGYGWGQVVDDGYGMAYMIKENSIHINIVSKYLRNPQMRHYLSEALLDIQTLLNSTGSANESTVGKSKL